MSEREGDSNFGAKRGSVTRVFLCSTNCRLLLKISLSCVSAQKWDYSKIYRFATPTRPKMDEGEYDEVRRRQPETPVRRSVQLEGRSTRAREDERRSRSRTRHEGRRGITHHLRSRSRSTREAGGGRLGRSRSRRRESYDDDDLRQKLRLLEDQLLKRNEQRRRDEATTNYVQLVKRGKYTPLLVVMPGAPNTRNRCTLIK
ncbi:hypothetical protein HW555_008952 [Spodoptera exigua]|uniref:Uncharacterized protein n=1 Tax=Spodoptera exigua TaxID=7107 RepID=A0A835GC46_SPOEX|nr:hypothetical protein HW555_008952 [Spodoptera exigua]